ncbi:MAG TPA: glycosyltransferase family 39 protein [Bryobacteraceae bacterium]|nr:glycosyltransferase family 39 protein [Bryobacteraceae bacterium]
MKQKSEAWLAPLFSILIFGLAGLALIPYPGLQNDEVFFAGPLYLKGAAFYQIEAGALKIPLMVMSYTGALKTWIYAGLFQIFGPSEWSVRVPALIAGMGTIWLTWLWTRRVAGDRAAAIAALLLSTDAVFLMTNTFDWGPVALQHLLLMAGLVALQSNRTGTAFFLWGLGLWDKALLVWPLIGLGAAAAIAYPGESMRRLKSRQALIATLALALGASPLIWFNIARRGQTATDNARFASTGSVAQKVSALRETANGRALFSYMVYPDDTAFRGQAEDAIGRVAARLKALPGDHTRNWMIPAYALAFVLYLALWRSPRRRVMTFLLIAGAVIWLQMALNRGTGEASHHVILIWPLPAIFVGIAFSEAASLIPRRQAWVAVAVTAVFVAGNLLNLNEYIAEFATNGARGGWTDAIYPLAEGTIRTDKTQWYGLVDWGCLNTLAVLHEGDLPMFVADVPAPGAPPTEANRKEILREIGSEDRVFIEHTDDKQMFPGVNGRLKQAAEDLGYVEQPEKTVRDSNGRPVFQLFRFRKMAPQ